MNNLYLENIDCNEKNLNKIIFELNEKNKFYDFESITGLDKNKCIDKYKLFVEKIHSERYLMDFRNNYYLFLIKLDEKVIGYCHLTENNLTDWLWVSYILIDKDYQGKGYGKRVMVTLEKLAKETAKKKTICVDIDDKTEIYKKKNNNLIKWYASLGYRYLDLKHEGNKSFFMEKNIE
jgi:GNAT superfamily N-acetyltransferase